MKRIGKRIFAGLLAIWLFCTVSLDGQAKTALAIKENVPLANATTVSKGDNAGDNSTKDEQYGALDELKPVESSEDEFIYYRNNGLDIVWNVTNNVVGDEITDTIGNVCLVTGNKINKTGIKMLKDAPKLTRKASNMQKEIDALTAKLGTPGSKGTQRRLNKLLAEQAEKSSTAARYVPQGNVYKIGGKLLSAASMGFDAYSIYDDYKSLGDLKNEHASLRAIEGGLYVVDMGFSAASIIAAGVVFAGGTVAAPVTAVIAVGGLIVGVASAIVGSEGFANFMNNIDNDFLRSFDNMVSSLFQNIKTALGIGCYKPNIYIYGADGRLVKVTFNEPGLLVVSDPYYDPAVGWSVIAENDGTLIDGENRSYDYLFYESATEKNMFTTQEAFLIGAEERDSTFREILTAYGFSEEETDDFVEFWDEKLEQGKEYLMYPQYTDTVDKAMPIQISPVPDMIYRLWFVFEEYDGQTYEVAIPVVIDRKGYFVVEWGGMIF